jgi:glycosyltransferase involved in cell wall biosynthesis
MSPARISLVIGQTTGGIGRHVLALVDEIVERGGIPSVYGPESTRVLGFEARGATFHEFDIPSNAISPAALLLKPGRLSRRLRGDDLVHAHGLRAGAIAGRAARRAGVDKRIVTIHNAVLDRKGFKAFQAWAGDRLLARRFSIRICVSNDLARLAREAGPSKMDSVQVIPVGSDIAPVVSSAAGQLRDSVGASEATGLVVAVGRLDRQKGFDVLIEAVGLLSRRPAPVVAIAGEGPERHRLERSIQEALLGDKVQLLGERNDARTLIEAADVFCMPSRWEGSPLALHEAMSYGKAIVATAVGGIVDMVSDNDAILVPPEDPLALARAMDRLLEDTDLRRRLGESAAKMAASWPHASESAGRVVDLYEQLLGRRLRN